MRIESIVNSVIKRLEQELPDKLYYHGVHHTVDVINAVLHIANAEKVSASEIEILELAALYHDTGFLFRYENNEELAATLAMEDLNAYNYNKEKIETIVELILSTKLRVRPTNKLEEILSDADFDYFGRNDFHEVSESLRQELISHGCDYSERQWDVVQIEFVENHRYYTDTAKKTRLPKKLDNLEEIKNRLKYTENN